MKQKKVYQTRIALPIASLIKSGIVTTDAQSFGGTKTFITINSTERLNIIKIYLSKL